MNEEIQDYLRHVLQAITGVETHLGQRRQFRAFVENLTTRRAVERELEIIGEAINRILKLDPTVPITDAKAIVYTRNRIIHGYDTVDEAIL